MIQDVSRGAIDETSSKATLLEQTSSQPNLSFSAIISGYWDEENRESALSHRNSLSRSELQTIGLEHGFAAEQPSL